MNNHMHGDAADRRPALVSGRAKGQANFRNDEDTKLASAYATVSTDAAVGTDQDGATFWGKIRENFIRRGGGPERTTNSLQNRFNKVLQCEVQKFIGFLQGALREYHSGWQMADYILEVKKQFQFKMTKVFKHDDVYDILKRSLPKYELVISSIDSRVARALLLLDSDANAGVVCINVTADTSFTKGNTVVLVRAHERTSLLTPRPSIGKRKAKLIEFARQQKKRQEGATTPTIVVAVPLTNQQLMVEAAKNGRNMARNRLAAAAERKNNMTHEQKMLLYYTKHPNSAEAVAFLRRWGSDTTMNNGSRRLAQRAFKPLRPQL